MKNKNIHNNIYIIIGTRAQLIKMAPIMVLLEKEKMDYILIFTGQHIKTMDSMLRRFNIKKPDYVLYDRPRDIVSSWKLISWFFYCLAKGIKLPIAGGIALLHGDTQSTLLGAIICKIKKIKVAHIEAGLRSHNIFHPFPEELTRIMVTKLSEFYFVQDQKAYDNLSKYNKIKINLKANTLLDTLRIIEDKKTKNIKIEDEKFCIVTLHRFENIFFKKAFIKNIELITRIAKKIKVLFVLHPATESNLKKWDLFKLLNNKNIQFIPRLDYFEFIALVKKSDFIVTDGGSCQEESSYLGIPCLLLRKATERSEGLGSNVVMSNYDKKIIDIFINNYNKHKIGNNNINLSPSAKIISFLKNQKQL